MVKIVMLVAVAENNVIGHEGDMPWHLSTDLKRFKQLTLGKPMIMGRKTFDSIGRPLPGRTSLVVTRNKQWQHEGVVPVSSLESAVELAKEIAVVQGQDEICIIGGGQIFADALPMADVLHVTKVHAEPQGDVFFPLIDPKTWQSISHENVPAGEADSCASTYIVFNRQ